MENVKQDFATKLLFAAVESGALKLRGSGTTVNTATANANIDAKYLLTLLTALKGHKPG